MRSRYHLFKKARGLRRENVTGIKKKTVSEQTRQRKERAFPSTKSEKSIVEPEDVKQKKIEGKTKGNGRRLSAEEKGHRKKHKTYDPKEGGRGMEMTETGQQGNHIH